MQSTVIRTSGPFAALYFRIDAALVDRKDLETCEEFFLAKKFQVAMIQIAKLASPLLIKQCHVSDFQVECGKIRKKHKFEICFEIYQIFG